MYQLLNKNLRRLFGLFVLVSLISLANVTEAADVIVDNTEADFSSTGLWGFSTGVPGYYGSDYLWTSGGDGSRTATWQFNIGTAGTYNVQAQWTAHSNRATNAPYTLYNNGILVAHVTLNQQINGGQFNSLGTFALAAGTLQVVLDNGASGDVVADAVQITFTGAVSNLPPDGTINTPTGNVTITAGQSVNFTGTYYDPDGDPAVQYLWEFGAGSGVADSNAKDPGLVQFNTTGTFTVTFTVTDSNLAADPTPAQITVTVAESGSSVIVDNTEADFSSTGLWDFSTGVPGYYGSDYLWTSGGDGSRTATWQFNIGTAGTYNVQAQWTAHSNRATNAPYTLYNNGILVAHVTLNQQINGGQFNSLGTFALAAGTLQVVLDNGASGVVIADAVQITFTGAVSNLPPDGTINTPTGNVTITAGQSVNFTGTYYDPDGDPAVQYLWEFGAGSGVADSNAKDPGLVQFNTTGTFTVTFTVTDSNLAADPTPAQITVTVAESGSSVIVDNTEADFSSTGLWDFSTGVPGYYGSDYLWTSGGDGSRTATWQFNIGTAGTYNVQAQWTAHSNRATNAPYTLYNNGRFVAMVRANQQINGGQFNLLGTYTLSAGTLQVVLDNGASGVVIADAIRVVTPGSPQLDIISPVDNTLVSSSYMTVNVGVSNMPAGWGIEFVLDGDPLTSVIDYSTPFEHTFTGLLPAEYTAEVYLVNESGVRQTGFSKYTSFGVGDYYIAFGDSITHGSHDDIVSDNTSNDGRNTGGGYEPILNNLLTNKSGYPQTVINAGVSGNTTADALIRLPSVISDNQEATHVLILLGTNDAYWFNLKSGVGLVPGQTDYADSYKDHMQQIISSVVASGKIPVLAKVLMTQPPGNATNELIQEYNTVIDELVLSNGITLAPPDFYSHFESNPSIYADDLHPNGNGYIDMANLWSNIFTY